MHAGMDCKPSNNLPECEIIRGMIGKFGSHTSECEKKELPKMFGLCSSERLHASSNPRQMCICSLVLIARTC